MALFNLCMEEKKKDREFKFLIKPGLNDLEFSTKRKGEAMGVRTNLQALGEIPQIKLKYTSNETTYAQKLRQTESARVKRKPSQSPKQPAKKHAGYSSPDKAFDDEEMDQREITAVNLEEELEAAAGTS